MEVSVVKIEGEIVSVVLDNKGAIPDTVYEFKVCELTLDKNDEVSDYFIEGFTSITTWREIVEFMKTKGFNCELQRIYEDKK